MILCDTDIMIDISRGVPAALAWLDELAAPPALPGITVLELIQGCTNNDALQRLLGLIAGMAVIWPDMTACNRAVELMKSFHLSHGLQKYDALVAVTALSSGTALHTFNRKHFGFIPGLDVIEPYVRQ